MCLILDNCSQKNLENYNSLLQKKIVDLEKQLLNQKLVKQNSSINNASFIFYNMYYV